MTTISLESLALAGALCLASSSFATDPTATPAPSPTPPPTVFPKININSIPPWRVGTPVHLSVGWTPENGDIPGLTMSAWVGLGAGGASFPVFPGYSPYNHIAIAQDCVQTTLTPRLYIGYANNGGWHITNVSENLDFEECDSITATLDIRIDCPWISTGSVPILHDIYNGGTKIRQSISINPYKLCYTGPSVFYLDGTVSGSGSVWVNGAPTQSYGPTLGYDDTYATVTPMPGCPPCLSAVSFGSGITPECAMTHPPDTESFITVTGGSVTTIAFHADASNPCAIIAPAINGDIAVEIAGIMNSGEVCPSGYRARASGSHNGFPTYDLVVGSTAIHLHQHCAAGTSPTALGNPLYNVAVNTPWVQVQ